MIKQLQQQMRIKFWGVRGSIPSPGLSTVRYGGNTSCVSVQLGEDKILVLDAGTGIRELGKTLVSDRREIFVLLSHIHWDHIHGFPFFAPLYQKDRVVHVFTCPPGKNAYDPLLGQMDGVHFPVSMDKLPSECRVITQDAVLFMPCHGFKLARVDANHPGGASGYRIENNGRSLVYLTDNELDPPYEKRSTVDDLARFCRGADILVHDAQYTDQDMPLMHGWGHSLVSQACQLASAAGVKHLVLFHHDPSRTDDQVDEIQESARAWFKQNNRRVICTAAFEGMTLEL
ncbi:MAG: MBL fold metallo-hydrolase [Desulfocucumaceae bacterium]